MMYKRYMRVIISIVLFSMGIVQGGLYKVILYNFTLVPIDVQIINAVCKDNFLVNIAPDQKAIEVDLGGICCIKGIKIKKSGTKNYVDPKIGQIGGTECWKHELYIIQSGTDLNGNPIFEVLRERPSDSYVVLINNKKLQLQTGKKSDASQPNDSVSTEGVVSSQGEGIVSGVSMPTIESVGILRKKIINNKVAMVWNMPLLGTDVLVDIALKGALYKEVDIVNEMKEGTQNLLAWLTKNKQQFLDTLVQDTNKLIVFNNIDRWVDIQNPTVDEIAVTQMLLTLISDLVKSGKMVLIKLHRFGYNNSLIKKQIKQLFSIDGHDIIGDQLLEQKDQESLLAQTSLSPNDKKKYMLAFKGYLAGYTVIIRNIIDGNAAENNAYKTYDQLMKATKILLRSLYKETKDSLLMDDFDKTFITVLNTL